MKDKNEFLEVDDISIHQYLRNIIAVAEKMLLNFLQENQSGNVILGLITFQELLTRSFELIKIDGQQTMIMLEHE